MDSALFDMITGDQKGPRGEWCRRIIIADGGDSSLIEMVWSPEFSLTGRNEIAETVTSLRESKNKQSTVLTNAGPLIKYTTSRPALGVIRIIRQFLERYGIAYDHFTRPGRPHGRDAKCRTAGCFYGRWRWRRRPAPCARGMLI
ncbi:hypothetical protein EVAR_11951_1 [Eumeta japonica]|uniref:Uncharacterized protein n=1 Tax=Eumeta variegata TaxID=151549 RepID=A0A4C1U4T3_EUMVA|nr:hypothetical protein EVAR_11951_1 [Eumeta japonica]